MMIFKNPENLLRDLVHREIAVHRHQPSRALIIVRYGGSLLLISRQTRLNHFQPIVIAGYQLRPVFVAKLIDTGRLEVDVIDPPTGGTRTASSNSEQQLIIVHVQLDHNWPGPSGSRVVKELVIQQRIQPSSLRRRSWKTVQNIAPLAVRLASPDPDHLTNQVVRTQSPPSHDRLGGHTQF